MKKHLLLAFFSLLIFHAQAQLPGGGQWGCPSVPIQSTFDTTCFQRNSELLLGQGYFDHYGGSDPVYLVIPQNRPSYAIALAVAWNYYRNVLGHDKMSINQWFATMGQENGFATYNGVALPNTIYDVEAGANVAIPCDYPRGCNSNACAGAGHCWHVSQNGSDGPFHNTLAGYQTISPYVPNRYPGPAATYHQLYNSNMEMAAMNKTFYDLSIYRRAEFMNNVDLAAIESAANDPYGVEAAQALAYNLGPNAANAISVPGYTTPAGIATNTNWASTYYSGGVSCYAQRVAAMTAVLDNQETRGKTNYNASGCGSANNWDFYSFYDSQIKWDTVLASINRLLLMYPEINGVPAAKAAYIAAVQTAFNRMDSDGNTFISYRYEMGAVIDAITMNLPKDDPGFNAQYAINGTGCKLNCRAPYTTIKTSGPLNICTGQSVILTAEVDAPTSSTIYQWQRNGVNIGGATSMTYTATTAGTYGVVVCWSTFKESDGTAVVCCAQPQCEVTVTVSGTCNTCGMGLTLTPTANSCTSMANGSIQASVTGGPFGTLVYTVTGPAPATTTTTFTGAATSHTFTNLRDGKYTVVVNQQSTPTCRAVQDIFIIPTTVIEETVLASYTSGSCQLDANIINQQPNTCAIQVSYGSLNVQSWDRSFFMDLKSNGITALTLFESYPSAGTRDDPWDWWPFSWPNGGAGNAPNVKTMTVSDGDIITVNGVVLVPQGTPAPGFIDGGVRIDGATFTNTSTSASASFATFRYQAPAPVAGARQMGASYRVTCPVVTPPAFTYSWSPAGGLSNPNIKNPTVGVATTTLYTVTATHPTNTSCQLTSSVSVTGPTGCGPLPVTLLDFNAEKAGETVVLSWTTINEKNCKTYQVKRSADGVSFENIGTITCNNSSSVSEYTFTDYAPAGSICYYQLEEIDFDGQSFLSEIRQVTFNDMLVHIQPNPFGHDTKVTISGTFGESVKIEVTDMSGKRISEKTLTSDKTVSIGSDFTAGVYVLRVLYQDQIKNYKIVKQ